MLVQSPLSSYSLVIIRSDRLCSGSMWLYGSGFLACSLSGFVSSDSVMMLGYGSIETIRVVL